MFAYTGGAGRARECQRLGRARASESCGTGEEAARHAAYSSIILRTHVCSYTHTLARLCVVDARRARRYTIRYTIRY